MIISLWNIDETEGLTIADRIARGPVPLDEARHIAKLVGEALAAAHEPGFVHAI